MKTICLALLAVLGPATAFAYPGQGVPNPLYPDGTGNDAVEQLNNAQLDQNYRGPVYYPGQIPPSSRPIGMPPPNAPGLQAPIPRLQP